MEQKPHFFFALKLPESTKLIMKEHLAELKEVFPFKRWVHYEDLHITLAFLGFAAAEQLEAANKNVADAIQAFKPFQLRMNQLGFFGRLDQPRIFFADTEESNELKLIRQKVFAGCADAGFKLETRSFRPHITVARKWEGNIPFRKDQLQLWKKLQPEPLVFTAETIALYQTHLDKTPKYEAIKLFTLNENI